MLLPNKDIWFINKCNIKDKALLFVKENNRFGKINNIFLIEWIKRYIINEKLK